MPSSPWTPDASGKVDLVNIAAGAFEDAEAAREYAKELREAMKAVVMAMSRTAFLVVAAALLFFLLTYARTAADVRLNLGLVTVAGASGLERVLPVVVAYLTYQLAGLAVRFMTSDWIHEAIVLNFAPALARAKLHDLLIPATPRMFQVGGRVGSDRLEHSRDAAALLMTTALLVAPFAFEVFAFARLFGRYGMDDVLTWVAVSFTLIVAVSTIATWWHWRRDDWYLQLE